MNNAQKEAVRKVLDQLCKGGPKDKVYKELECWNCSVYQFVHLCNCSHAFNQANYEWRQRIDSIIKELED